MCLCGGKKEILWKKVQHWRERTFFLLCVIVPLFAEPIWIIMANNTVNGWNSVCVCGLCFAGLMHIASHSSRVSLQGRQCYTFKIQITHRKRETDESWDQSESKNKRVICVGVNKLSLCKTKWNKPHMESKAIVLMKNIR